MLVDEKDAENKIFHHISIYEVAFLIKDYEKFSNIWNDTEIQKVFEDKQLLKIIWPIFRQNVLEMFRREVLNSFDV